MMNQTYTVGVDIKGLQHAVTMLAVAAGLAGWAVIARPDAAVATSSLTTTAPIVQTIAPPVESSAPVTLSSPASSAPSLQVVVAPTAASLPVVTAPAPASSIRVVTPAQVPVAATRSSR